MSTDVINFLDFQRTLSREKKDLNQLIHADSKGCFIYYLVPYTNLQKIYESGGIKPRNLTSNFFDISSREVQNRRKKKIQLVNQGKLIDVDLHDCVNFFLNPFNNTFFQFRRNALLRSSEGSILDRLVCILELDFRKLARLDHLYWNVFEHNLAKSNGNVNNGYADFKNYKWSAIYQVKNASVFDPDGYRSAEMLFYLDKSADERMIPQRYINRVLAYKGDYKEVAYHVSKQGGPRIDWFDDINVDNPSIDDALNYELDWVDSLSKVLGVVSPKVFCAALTRVKGFEGEIGIQLKTHFNTAWMADSGSHGMSHVVRVMFWVLFLAGISNELGYPLKDDEVTAALYAAFIHDLGRTNNNVDEYHGKVAAVKFQNLIRNKFPRFLADRCLRAVEYHSLSNPADTSDPITQLLMDADAIDRGRFAPPDRYEGCLSSKLRSPVLRNNKSFCDVILWSAYRLAKVTQSNNWGDHPCEEFYRTLSNALSVVSKSKTASSQERRTAYQLVRIIKIPTPFGE